MTDKTAIDALKKICSIETGTWDNPVPFSKLYHEAKGIAIEAIAAIEADKPAESAEECLSKMFRDIRKIGYITDPLRLTHESHDACVDLLNHFAESYHAEQCTACRKDRRQLHWAPRV